jgi:hypothetical protein
MGAATSRRVSRAGAEPLFLQRVCSTAPLFRAAASARRLLTPRRGQWDSRFVPEGDPNGSSAASLSRELAVRVEQGERLALAAAEQARAVQRIPSPLQSFAISIGGTACAIVLGGVVLMVIADVVNLIDPINLWPLVSLGIAIVAIAVVSLAAGRDRRLEDVVRSVTAPWESERRFTALEEKVDLLLKRVPDPEGPPNNSGAGR